MISWCAIVSAQNIPALVSNDIAVIRAGQYPDRTIIELLEKKPQDVVAALAVYQNDTLPAVRTWVYSVYSNVLQVHSKPRTLRNDLISRLTEGLADRDKSTRNACISALTGCFTEDFTELVQVRFVEIFNSSNWFNRDFIKLAGFIGNELVKPTLERLAFTPTQDERRLQWHAYLALSRMGDQNAVSWCLGIVRRLKLNDDVTYELLPDLVYVRQHRTFDYLIEVLNSDEKACRPSNPDLDTPILCGYRVMEYLAPVVKKYPLKLHPSGDIDTDDYEKALLTARAWFTKRNGQYEIITNTF
jgi:alkylhydroperoxidase family enzyme